MENIEYACLVVERKQQEIKEEKNAQEQHAQYFKFQHCFQHNKIIWHRYDNDLHEVKIKLVPAP